MSEKLRRNLLKYGSAQAILQGLKPCVVGIVLATGVFMVLRNLLPPSDGVVYDLQGIIITSILAGIMVLYPKLTKKKLSPIALILCAAVCGMAVYGI